MLAACNGVFPAAVHLAKLIPRQADTRWRADSDHAGPTADRWAPERGAVALDQVEKDLRNPFVVACVSAHPGDEDSAMLVYCRKKLGAHTVSAFATRGEQIEDEDEWSAEEPVDVVRTRQALQVAAAEGSDLYFLNLPDQPADQPADDTAAAWEKNGGLLSMVRFIRTVHPDVLLSGGELPSPNTAEQAVQRLIIRGIDSAADPAQFPEAGSPWLVTRLYLRGTEGDHNAAVNASEFDLIRGQTYARMANIARTAYPAALRNESPAIIYYKMARPAISPADTGESILKGLAVAKSVEEQVSIPQLDSGPGLAGLDPRQLAQTLSGRLYLMRSAGSDEELHERFGADYFRIARFIRCLEKAIALALGLDFEMQLSDDTVTPGQKFGVRLKFTNGTDHQLAVEFQTPPGLPSPGVASTPKADLTNAKAQSSITRDYEYQAPESSAVTVPHRLHLYESNLFPAGDGLWPPGRPFGLPFSVTARVNAGAVNISLQAMATIDVIPSFELSVTPPAALLKDLETVRTVDFTARVVNHTPGPFAGELWVVPLAVATDDYEPIQVRFSKEDQEVDVPLKLQVPIMKPPLATSILLEFRRARPAPPASLVSYKIEVRQGGLAVPDGLRIGYISQAGANSKLAEALQQLGCKHELLSIENLRFADGGTDLKRFNTIIVDRGAYRDLPELVRLNNKLLDYARAGGNLVVMAQKAEVWNSMPGLAPFPITLSKRPAKLRMNMTRIVAGGAAALTQPNSIEGGELEGWPISGRTSLPDAWDAQYQSLIAYGPADATPAPSLLLLAKAGEGTYLYFAVGADRAISEMNPGAYRLISNLVSVPKYKGSI